jgi:hypothetical protein
VRRKPRAPFLEQVTIHLAAQDGFSFSSERPGRTVEAKIGRNDLCPCASGRKVKKCHLGISPPADPVITDPRLWPLLAAFATNAVTYLSEIVPPFSKTGFAEPDFGVRSQNIAIAYYACVAYRVASAIIALVTLNQGEEAIGLRRELEEARISLAYYQRFKDEATKLVASRDSNRFSFHERLLTSGLLIASDEHDVARLKRAAELEQARHPEIMTSGKKSAHWREPNTKAKLKALHDAWSNDPDARHAVEATDAMLQPEMRGSPGARADSQYSGAIEVSSQWLHNTFVLSDRYIDWRTSPKLRPLSNSMRESPNRFLEMVTDTVLAVANGVHRQTDTLGSPRLQPFGVALRWFQSVLDFDEPKTQ